MTRNRLTIPPAPAAATLLAAVLLAFAQPVRAELEIEGVNGDAARNIRLFTALSSEPCDAEAWRVRRGFRALARETERALEPFGYYDPTITTSLRFEEQCWVAEVTVDPGEPVRLRNVSIRIENGNDDTAFDSALTDETLLPGRRLRHASYEALKRRLTIAAADRGYIDADFVTSRIDVYPEELAADIEIVFATGERYALGNIEIRQDFLKPELVAGFIDLEPGQPYDRESITRTYSNLTDSGFFGRIQVTPEMSAAEDGRIPVSVTLEPGTRLEYSVGVGASTDTGLRLRTGFRNNRLNRSGHRFKADLNVSTLIQGLSGEYRVPLANPRSEWMSFTGSVSHEKTDTFETDRTTLGLRRTKQLSDTWIRTAGFDFSFDSFEVADVDEDTFLFIPLVMFDHKLADRDLYPNRGRRFTVEFSGTSDSIGSSTSFLRMTAWARWVYAFSENTRLITRGQAGRIETDDFEGLPPSVRYFAGGDQSVRGYDFESLGPTNEDGEVIGGTNLLVGSVEIEQRIKGNWFGAAFVDAGNAYNEEEFDPAIGAGLGLKWRSPVGPVRFYIGVPVDDDDRSPRFHLRLGSDL